VRVWCTHIAVAVTTLSLALYGAMMVLFVRTMAVGRARGRRGAATGPAMARPLPRVSILKPLAGCDDDLDANLESFARLDHPAVEILLGVARIDDAAFPVARAFALRHPELDVKLCMTDPAAAMNPKVAQLVGLRAAASGEVLVISDSNVRVPPAYLRSMLGGLADPGVGMVWSVFSGDGERTLGSALENLQIGASTMPGIVALNAVFARTLVVGKSMAFRAEDLDRMGGFGSVGDVLAEDHVLGRRFLDAGFRIRTSFDLVENRNTAGSIGTMIDRHTRWAKLRRSLLPFGFFGEPLMTPVAMATLGVVVAPSTETAAAFAVTCLLQTAAAMVALGAIRGRRLAWWYAPLEIVRSYVVVLCWARACVSRRIAWRGHPFTLQAGSVIVPLPASQGRSSGRTRLAA
jgi:ceramide glucosyltransferase